MLSVVIFFGQYIEAWKSEIRVHLFHLTRRSDNSDCFPERGFSCDLWVERPPVYNEKSSFHKKKRICKQTVKKIVSVPLSLYKTSGGVNENFIQYCQKKFSSRPIIIDGDDDDDDDVAVKLKWAGAMDDLNKLESKFSRVFEEHNEICVFV
ncbi:unnamed protein product [Didymodactylos carnosus]|uniref:Uncharacterized protein n=1 Tax=Didymodactylos carnosus TaxID=1234261 RepID=A0A8S2G564_9BILA|nr:unnamed protein product [Didymodactylos carnosus]CAF4449518.1 unnamed protein product [Didymodactylos carnosus]